MSVQYKIPEYVHVSHNCRHLLSRIFVQNPYKRITMSEIKSHPWYLKNLPRELKEEAQAAYYSRRGVADAAGSSSNGNANANAVAPAAYSSQSVEEIMRIVQEAQTLPKPARPVSGYGWDAASDDDDDQYEEEAEPEEEDDYDRTVRQVHASGEFDMSRLQI
jgi:serine/threonine-protein kinase SRK2